MIGIFKTNIATHEDRQNILQAIMSRFEVGQCNVDLEDCDKVLRITGMKAKENDVIDFVKGQGFYCDVLE